MWLVELLKGLPKELIVFLTAATPIIEVRGSIPIGVLYFGLKPFQVFYLSILGSILPVIPVLWFLNSLTGKIRKNPTCNRFFEWLFTRTRAKSKIIEDLELLGLTIFIAIPLPGSGVWTGTVAAYLFRFSWWKTLLCAILGTTISAVILMFFSLKLSGNI
jgi:uncharacterized membrane protein